MTAIAIPFTLYEYAATCERVVDGDTVDLAVDLGFRVKFRDRFRILGIDTPETYGVRKDSEEYAAGKKSAAWLTNLILGKLVIIRTRKDSRGKYGRWLAEVFIDTGAGKFLNVGADMIRLGLAKEYGS